MKPAAGGNVPCSACLCAIGGSLYKGLQASGVDVAAYTNSLDQGALAALFSACQ